MFAKLLRKTQPDDSNRADELAEGAGETIADEKIRIYFKSAVTTVPLNIVTGAMTAAFVFQEARSILILALWYVTLVAVCAVRFLIARRATAEGATPSRVAKHVYTGLTAVVGSLWGSVLFLVVPDASLITFQQITFMVAGMTSAAAVAAAAYSRGVTAFIGPALGLAALSFILQGGTRGWVLAAMILFYFVFVKAVATGYGRTIREMLEANQAVEASRTRVETQARALKELARRHETAARRAEGATQAKSSFLAFVSHEIRTPLVGLLGVARSLRGSSLDAEQSGQAQTICDSGDMLMRLVDDLLDFSEIEAGKMKLELAEFRLADLAEETQALWSPRAEARRLDFRVESAGEMDVRVSADATRIKQVLFNLVSNAIKFTHRGEVRILLQARTLDDGRVGLRAEVRDTGCGVPKEAESRLFQDFSRITMENGRRVEGAGLGLAISRRLVDLMGGRIGHESRRGLGSVFWFELPLNLASSAAAIPVAGAPVADGAPSESGERALRVLVAEDNALNRAVLEGFLLGSGWRVDFVENGAEAVEAASAKAYDVILMDVRMPVMDGLAATRAIRDLPTTAAMTPIVALTANAYKEDEALCLAAGMDGYVSKPIDAARLFGAIRAAIGSETTSPARQAS